MKVEDVLVMGTIVTLSLDWGEALEDHPRRGNGKGGKVLRMVEPHDGFVERCDSSYDRPRDVLGVFPESPLKFFCVLVSLGKIIQVETIFADAKRRQSEHVR